MAEAIVTGPNEIFLDGSVDEHTHPREDLDAGDGRMNALMPLIAQEHEVIVAIGNLPNPRTVLNGSTALNWRQKIYQCTPADYRAKLNVLVAALVRDSTPPELVRQTWDVPEPQIGMLKIFFSGVSNDGGNSVEDVRNIENLVRATYRNLQYAKRPLHIKVHAERKFDRNGKRLEMRDREFYAVENDVRDLFKMNPGAEVTIAHVSDVRTIDWILHMRSRGYSVYGEIATHYLLRCHEDLYESKDHKGTAFQANDLCWPIYKSAESMFRLQEAALSGNEAFSYGSDCACHIDDPSMSSGVKITSDGEVCGGTTILPAVGKAKTIEMFVKHGQFKALNAFLSGNARKKLGLGHAMRIDRYRREDWVVANDMPIDTPRGQRRALLFGRGETCKWKLAV